jgi:gentisate 1,2-dioxygenase
MEDQTIARSPRPAAANPQQREAFYARLEPHSLAPLWTRLKSLVPAAPTPLGVAHHWRYADVRPYVLEAAQHISAEEAERRVLILENPGLRGTSQITHSLFAGLQLIMPGEIAPAHRHTQSALRLIVEGSGAYTAVAGEKTIMQPGDFVITPSWTWHHHGHEASGPMIWLDGLDIPIVALFNSTFREDHEHDVAEITRPTGDSLARYGSGLLPVDYASRSLNSPVFNYPYARTRDALHALTRAGAPDPHHGHLMRYVNGTAAAARVLHPRLSLERQRDLPGARRARPRGGGRADVRTRAARRIRRARLARSYAARGRRPGAVFLLGSRRAGKTRILPRAALLTPAVPARPQVATRTCIATRSPPCSVTVTTYSPAWSPATNNARSRAAARNEPGTVIA